jgi:hypothetical protein
LRLVREEREEDENRRRQAELERRKIIELREQEILRIQDLEERANDYQKAELIRKYLLALSAEAGHIGSARKRRARMLYLMGSTESGLVRSFN